MVNGQVHYSQHKATCIWKFVQRQLLHLGFCWWYCLICFGYQTRIFYFSFFSVSHKSLRFITWNLIEYLHTQDFQRATAHLNVWANVLLFCFVYGCKTTHKNILTGSKSKKLVFTLGSPLHFKPYLLICGLILLKLLSFLLYFFFLYWIHK